MWNILLLLIEPNAFENCMNIRLACLFENLRKGGSFFPEAILIMPISIHSNSIGQ